MTAYYNEFDPFAAAWLRELIKEGLIADGEVDERSIADVRPGDLDGFTQCHFFAGIGGWSYALRLAGWPDDRPVWTGSCPCQPFSAAGKRLGQADPRHLWPEFKRLIADQRPSIVFGEQVTSPLGREWLSNVRADLEAAEYAFGAANLCAASVGAPHTRQRNYWVAYTSRGGRRQLLPADTTPEPLSEAVRAKSSFWLRSGGQASRGRDERTRLCKPGLPLLGDGLSKYLDGFGNAIVPQIGAAFIKAAAEALT